MDLREVSGLPGQALMLQDLADFFNGLRAWWVMHDMRPQQPGESCNTCQLSRFGLLGKSLRLALTCERTGNDVDSHDFCIQYESAITRAKRICSQGDSNVLA